MKPISSKRGQKIYLDLSWTIYLTCPRGIKIHLTMSWPNPSHTNKDTKCISTCVWTKHLMTERTENASLHLLTKPIPCQQGHKMYLNLYWSNPSCACVENHCISKSVDQTHPMPVRTKMYINMCCPNIYHASENTKVISTRVDKTHTCQLGHKMHLNMCWQSKPHVSHDRKCISTCVVHARNRFYASLDSQYISTYVGQTPPMQCEEKSYLNMWWPNRSHASEDTKCISTHVGQTPIMPARTLKYTSTCVDQTPPMPARTQTLSQHVLTIHIPCQQRHKMYLNICWPSPSTFSEDTKSIPTCFHQNSP